MGLVVSELRKSFGGSDRGELRVLMGVSFEISAGEMVAVTGASGAGKSTLLHLLGGLEAADNGTILLDGFDVTGAGASAMTRYRARKLGFVFQFHHLLPDLSAAENVAMPLRILRQTLGSSLSLASEALDEVGMGSKVDQPVGTLSGGEQQRVAIVRAIVAKPRLVLADEPTGNLDASTGEEIEKILLRYCRQNSASVVIATHNTKLASICDRRFLLEEGILQQFDV
ncbi:MAG: lipoprotein-releasing system ATP-binding protein [Blastocatellia bacterium]|nr:lipoprotein-releasing system ATP-binding protein [Blastocatellia bacterium]